MEWTKSLDITLTLDGPFAVVEIDDTSSSDHVRYDFRYDESGRNDINNMRDAAFRIGQEIMDWFALLLEWRDDEEEWEGENGTQRTSIEEGGTEHGI